MTTSERHRNSNEYLRADQVLKVLESASDNPRDHMLLRLGFGLGSRVNEMVAIELSDIDFKQGYIKLWDDKKHTWTWKYDKEQGRRVRDKLLEDGRWRRVKVGSDIMQELEQYVLLERSAWVSKGSQSLWDLSWKSLENIIQKHVKRALGISKSWHCTRDTYITLTIHKRQAQGYTVDKIIKYLSKQTGDTVAMLFDKYTSINQEEIEDIAEQPLY